MSKERKEAGLDKEDYYYLKVRKVVESEARIALYNILSWICPRDLTQTFEDHVKRVLKLSNNKFKLFFNDTMVMQMNSNPSGDKFDVTLLNACITCTCPPDKSWFSKDYIRPIKDFRNTFEHNESIENEIEMENEFKVMRDLMLKALQKAKEIFNRTSDEVDDLVERMDASLEKIKDAPIPSSDFLTTDTIIDMKDKCKNIVRDIGAKSLRENYKGLSNVDPASWITGKERLNVEMVYTKLDIILKKEKEKSHFSVGHEELLQLKASDDQTPNFVIVEGDAGAGKSTLTKYILAQWASLEKPESTSTILGLGEYELVLYIECRNKYISDFLDLLLTLMPKASYVMTDDDLLRTVLSMKTLVIIDGFDECNENSKKLLEEMVGSCLAKSDNKLAFVITTRPTKMKNLLKLCGNHSLVHSKITGIPPERRIEFVQRLHDEMLKEKQSKESTSRLVDYMKHSQCRLGEHYRLPLNLTLLCYLWASDPEKVNSVTSATSLYEEVLALLKLRVISKMPGALCEEADVNSFLEMVFVVYLETHKSGDLQLSSESIKKLENECKEHSLSFEDMCGAFFAVDNEWTSKGLQIHLSAPHKSIMEFYIAYHIYNNYRLASNENDELAKKLEALHIQYKNFEYKVDENKKTLREVLSRLLNDNDDLDDIDLSHYQNVFIHLGGLLALKNRNLLHECGEELVNILELSEVTETEWLDLVAEAECDPQFTVLVAQGSDLKKLVIRDGHTSAALEMFKSLESRLPVQVILQTEVRYIPKLDDLMKSLSVRNCSVELLLNNHWKNPQYGMSTKHLKQLCNQTCSVTRFTGNLDNLKILPSTLENLRITLANNDQATLICDDITRLNDDEQLEYIGVHVLRGISPDVLRPLPIVKPINGECGSLWLSGVEDGEVDNTAAIIARLVEGERKLHSLLLPRCLLSTDGFKSLLGKLKDAGVKVSKMVKTDSIILQKTDEKELKALTKDTFGVGCDFSWGSESSVW